MREPLTPSTGETNGTPEDDAWLGVDQGAAAVSSLGSVVRDRDWCLLNIWVGELLHSTALPPQARVEVAIAVVQWASDEATRAELEGLTETERWQRLERQVERCIAQRAEMRPPAATRLS